MKQFPIVSTLFALAFVLLLNDANVAAARFKKRAPAPLNDFPGSFKVVGDSGIAAMHMVLTAPTKILIIDKVEKNPFKQNDGRVAVSVEYDIKTNKKRALSLNTNTFCSAGSFLGNGTLVHTGGAEAITEEKFDEGFESLRIFEPCGDGTCDWFENPKGLTTKRWYPSMVSLSDGRVLILGGAKKPIGANSEEDNNPTVEFFPNEGSKPEPFPFLVETLPFNLYPAVHLLPGPETQTQLFVFSNTDSIIWDWVTKKIVKRLPKLPGPPRLYPLTGASVMLPLLPEENYAPQILICGGVAKQDPNQQADNTCGRINLSNDNAKWEIEEFGGFPRNMPDAVILADGKTMFLNGAGRGTAGYNTDKGKKQAADEPVLTPVLYDHLAPKGKRFTSLTSSNIPRLYHSVATMIPDGRVFVTGSNPNPVIRTKDTKFLTEFRVEMFTPHYLQQGVNRADITSVAGNTKLNKGAINVNYDAIVQVTATTDDPNAVFSAALVHYGFVTHSVHMSQRYVACTVQDVVISANSATMDVVMPPNGNIIPPGRHYLYISNKGVPAKTAVEIMIS